jgi:hypothetical protein
MAEADQVEDGDAELAADRGSPIGSRRAFY